MFRKRVGFLKVRVDVIDKETGEKVLFLMSTYFLVYPKKTT